MAVQSIAAGEEVTVPLPVPVALTVKVAAVAGVELNANRLAVKNDGNNTLSTVGELADKHAKLDSVVCRIWAILFLTIKIPLLKTVRVM